MLQFFLRDKLNMERGLIVSLTQPTPKMEEAIVLFPFFRYKRSALLKVLS